MSRTGLVLRTLAALAAAWAVVLAGGASPAFAGSGFAIAVEVHNSQQSVVSSDGTSCTWQVTSDITLVNLTNQSLQITAVGDSVSWTAADGTSGVVNSVTTIDDGGLQPGVVLGPNEQRTFSGASVEFVIPCKATDGDLAVRITTARGTSSGDAPFLESGTPVPLSAVGALGLTVGLAGAFTLVQRRRRRNTQLVNVS
jgi:hypothetical protein